jgi:hypothetical protein
MRFLTLRLTSTLSCEHLREFLKKFEMVPQDAQWAWRKIIHEKNLKSKI